MKTSDNVDKIIPAFIAFQADMPSVPKGRQQSALQIEVRDSRCYHRSDTPTPCQARTRLHAVHV
jgi:hypothetical protein